MSFAREKRLLLSALALLAPIPLPFNEVIEWPVLLLWLAAVGLLIRRAYQGADQWLPNWALNLMGLAYLPILLLDLSIYARGQLVRPVLHLALFGIFAKLLSLRRERDKWQTAMGIFFLFLASMATSVHPSVMVYLVAFLALAVVLLIRFAYFHVLTNFGHRELPPAELPVRGFVMVAVGLTLLTAIPLFALMPRLRTPFVAAPGAGGVSLIQASGFTDEISLDDIGQIRSNRAVVMRLIHERGTLPKREPRFKAASYDHYEGRAWRKTSGRTLMRSRSVDNYIRLSDARAVGEVRVFLEPLGSKSLVLPIEAVGFSLMVPGVELDRGGAIYLYAAPARQLEYQVEVAAKQVFLGADPEGDDEPAADLGGVTPAMAELAREWAGEGSPADRAARIERKLLTEYAYTMSFVGRGGENPLEDFLLRYKSGHCEYFASAMVLLLRAQGIPARVVTGFLGAEYNPWEDSWVVRQRNAHAWVEAFLAGEGWHTFDPTPAAGRPTSEPESVLLLARQAWDTVVFRWDRYVLTYSAYDQFRLLIGARDFFGRLWDQLTRRRQAPETVAPPTRVLETSPEDAAPKARRLRTWPMLLLLPLFAAVAGLLIWLRRRPSWTATLAYQRLRELLAGAGLSIPAALAPMALAEVAERRFPAAGPPTSRVVGRYLSESFGAEPLAAGEAGGMRAALAEIRRELRRTRRERSPSRRP